MPYTPPTRSPTTTSGLTSPLGSRQHSFTDMHQPSPPRSPRPNLPRSAYSAAYLQKTRRSPTFQTMSPPPDSADSTEVDADNHTAAGTTTSSLRQSPPPITGSNGIPAGAIMSPPDSTQNSSDDETENRSRSRQVQGLQDLEDAVRSLDVNQEPSSPTGSADDSNAPLTLNIRSAMKHTNGPRKAVHTHTQSAQESSFFDRRTSASSVASYNSQSSEESDEEVPRGPKPPLLRKKSGELVKPAIRPSSRRRHSSMPGTPTYSKAVHFDEEIEQVRHFLQVDRPIAVSAGTSPAEGHEEDADYNFGDAKKQSNTNAVSWEVRMANFPPLNDQRRSMAIRADRLFLSPDQKSLVGLLAVANLAFNKTVVVRFTLDYWKTTSEVVAEYDNDPRANPREDGYDQFKFSIKLSDQANLETRTLLLCLRYDVNGQQYWDNNDNQNYQVDFIKKTKPAPEEPRQVRTLPQSSKSGAPSLPRSRSTPAFDEDFASSLETSQLRFKNSRDKLMPDTPPPTIRKHNNSSQQFGSRYDFGASLSAALSNAQAALGDRSGIKNKSNTVQHKSNVNPAFFTGSPSQANGVGSPQPSTLLAQNKTLDSRAYQEFVSKYCFFGTNGKEGKPSPPVPGSRTRPETDGALDEEVSPTSPPVKNNDERYSNFQLSAPASNGDGGVENTKTQPKRSPSLSPARTGSPATNPTATYVSSPFVYPYTESRFETPPHTAIQG